nr:heme biosynthesis HemY N-terminal domain-containing protein [Lysobacter enzymogenes]
MNLFRNLLFWIVLALLGALVAQLLLQDPGRVVITYGGYDYLTNVPKALLMLVGGLIALWLVWKALSLPFVAMRRHRKKQARARLIDGLDALHQGHWTRAEKSLAQAARSRDVAAIAAVGAARAAPRATTPRRRRSTWTPSPPTIPSRAHWPRPNRRWPRNARRCAGRARRAGRAAAAAARTGPARAGVAAGPRRRTYGLLGALRQNNAWPSARLGRLEAQWAEAALREAADANVLADLWESLPKPLKNEPAAVAAYAERAAEMRWEEAAAKSLEQALDARWDESLAALYGRLPIGRLDARRAQAERWLAGHPGSPGLLLSLARLARMQGQWPQAEAYLHRALAQGAGSEAWEELGHGFAQAGDESRARLSYLNALRAARGEAPSELPGRDLRQKLFDEAVVEERDEFGMPRLRG